MLVNRCTCIRCGAIYELDEAVEPGTELQCDDCGGLMKAGRIFEGENHEGVLLRVFRKPPCPGCGCTESKMGKKIGISPSVYIRQCSRCHACWRGNAWYLEGQAK